MQNRFELLPAELVEQVLDEAFQLLDSPGVKVLGPEARELLADAGAKIDQVNHVAHITENLARQALSTVPNQFYLYDRNGNQVVQYGGNGVHFDPGSSGINVLDPDTIEHRPAQTPDLVRLIQVAEMLPQYDAQSTAVVCADVPKAMGDIYRLYLVLLYSNKPIVTGSFSVDTAGLMFDMLALVAGGRQALAQRPLAIFDVCPSPPLTWTGFAAQNLIDLARAEVPAEIVSMPLAGAAAPVTLLGSVVQHAAETLSGITIHQLAKPGSPIVWGGAPAIFDMRHGTTPMGAVETAMLNVCNAQIGKSLGLPTHGYLGASEAKIVDAQAGLESGITALLGAMAGINMISGAGMLDFLASQSAEKLVVDAEAIAMAKRLLAGVKVRTDPLATAMFAGFDFKADFLKQKITRQLFAEEQHLSSPVIDRTSLRSWQDRGRLDTFHRAKEQVEKLLDNYERPGWHAKIEGELQEMMAKIARNAGLDDLPELPGIPDKNHL
jgi:trimethylamine--corrinoid protein Co-methyltransferase